MRHSGYRQTKPDNPPPGIAAVREHEKARVYIESADRYLEGIGYTEHGFRHCGIVSAMARDILSTLGFGERDVELAAVAGFLHDMGNMAGREHHHIIGPLLAKEIMEDVGFDLREITRVMAAIVLHEEHGEADDVIRYDPVAAALLIADKSDVHRSRVRAKSDIGGDIHDRVNYAATRSSLQVDAKEKTISLSLVIDTRISQVMEYFEIFLGRMSSCRKAARALGCEFQIFINDTRLA